MPLMLFSILYNLFFSLFHSFFLDVVLLFCFVNKQEIRYISRTFLMASSKTDNSSSLIGFSPGSSFLSSSLTSGSKRSNDP